MDAKIKNEIYEQIIKECYWDSNITADQIKSILKNKDMRELKKLFSKIIYNSSDKLKALQIFTKEELSTLFKDFQATYNKKYIQKHIKVLENLLLCKKHYIKGLEWEKI